MSEETYNFTKCKTYTQDSDMFYKYICILTDNLVYAQDLVSFWEYMTYFIPDIYGLKNVDPKEFETEWYEGMSYLEQTFDLLKDLEEEKVLNTEKLQKYCLVFKDFVETKQKDWEPYEIVYFAHDITSDLILSLRNVSCAKPPKRLKWLKYNIPNLEKKVKKINI